MIEPKEFNWTAFNDIGESEDGVMYYAIYEYVGEACNKTFSGRQVTGYFLTNEQAWHLVEAHNQAIAA